MKTALLSKVALCVCPPAMLATTVVSVPPVRQAVHRATRPHHPVRHRPQPARSAAPRQVASIAPCPPAAAAVAPLLTFADLGPEDVSAVPVEGAAASGGPGGGGGGGAPILGGGGGVPILGGGPGPVATAPPVLSGVTPVSPIPEPSTWLMLIAGLGTIGGAMRSRRRRQYQVEADSAGMVLVPLRSRIGRRGRLATMSSAAVAGIGFAWANSRPVLAKSQAATLGGKAVKSAALTKLAMCVCPPAAMVAGTMALPPVRQAVYAATAPAPVTRALPQAVGASAIPCPPGGVAPIVVPAGAIDSATLPAVDTQSAMSTAPAATPVVPAAAVPAVPAPVTPSVPASVVPAPVTPATNS